MRSRSVILRQIIHWRFPQKKGTGLEELKELFCTLLRDNKILVERTISYQEAGILQQIRKSGELLEEEYRPECIFIRAYVTPEIYGSL